jgi:hypothetical protein
LKDFVVEFEKKAKKVIGMGVRKMLRKPEPKRPIKERVMEAKA